MLIKTLSWIGLYFILIPSGYAGGFVYTHTLVLGRDVYYEASLAYQKPTQLKKALSLLEKGLREMDTLLPAPAREKLLKVPIWLSENQGNGLVYHASAAWLQQNGRNPELVNGVEIQNIDDFIAWIDQQPMILLHEMSHALHHQLFAYNHADITTAFEYAKNRGLYRNVKRYNGAMVEAYALLNEREYFAELTEAYFGRNDYYPFTRDQLKQYDPVGFLMIESIWNEVAF